jgi:hypothetical protein
MCGRGESADRKKLRFAPGGDNILDFVTDNKYIFTGNNFPASRPSREVPRAVD